MSLTHSTLNVETLSLNESKIGTDDEDQVGDSHIQSAISLITLFGKQGIIPLCTAVAYIIRENLRLKKELHATEEKIEVFGNPKLNSGEEYNNSSSSTYPFEEGTDSSLTFKSSSIQSISPRSRSFPISCPSKNNHWYTNNSQPDYVDLSSGSEGSSHECNFVRKPRRNKLSYSLNNNNKRMSSKFFRRNYRTVSLSRMRKGYKYQTPNPKRYPSQEEREYNDENFKANLEKVITVAQIHRTDAASVEDVNSCSKDANISDDELLCTPLDSTLNMMNGNDCISPFPLSGCRCNICLEHLQDPDTDFYVCKGDGNALLPSGSRVLLTNGDVGTVLYLGHDDTIDADHANIKYMSVPLGVSVILPNKTKGFFSLNDVVEVLDNEIEVIDLSSNSNCEFLVSDSNNTNENLHSKQSDNFYHFEDEIINTNYKNNAYYHDENETMQTLSNNTTAPPYGKTLDVSTNVIEKLEENDYCKTIDGNENFGNDYSLSKSYTEDSSNNDINLFESSDSGIRLSFSSGLSNKISESLNGFSAFFNDGYAYTKSAITKKYFYSSERESEV